MKTNKRGGARKGAGKPALYDEPMERINVMLDKETVKFYSKIGKGNLSAGIRGYWRRKSGASVCVCPVVHLPDEKFCSDCGKPVR